MDQNSEQNLTPPVAPQPLPQQSVATSHGNAIKKLLLILLGLVFLLGLAGGAYYLGSKDILSNNVSVKNNANKIVTNVASATPTPDPTADWKVYEQSADTTGVGMPGFSLKYPQDWNKGIFTNTFWTVVPNTISSRKLLISFNTDPYIPSRRKYSSSNNFPAGSISFVSSTSNDSLKTRTVTADIVHDNYAYEITLSGFDADVLAFQPTFNEMLNTMVFNQTTNGKNISAWGKDVNTNISFLYPHTIKLNSGRNYGLNISTLPNPNHLSAQAFAAQQTSTGGTYLTGLLPDQPSYFSGMNAVVADGFSGGASPTKRAYIATGSVVIVLDFEGVGDNTANAILSTLKILQ